MMPAPPALSPAQAAELARILATAEALLALVDQGLAAMQAIVDGTVDAPDARGQWLRTAA